jgi:ferritin-like metal-binding protein YciE
VSELDGVWTAHRESGALPPMLGVRKRIAGDRGVTLAGPARLPFRVEGLTLRYEPPLVGLVDELAPEGEGFRGRTLLVGREIGTFTLRRLTMAEMTAYLTKHLDEAYAMEQNVLRMLDGMIETTDDPGMVDALEHHKHETQDHARWVKERLEAHGADTSKVREAGGILGALAKMPLDLVRGEKAGRNARDGYATEHMEIASYELLKRYAQAAGDEETVEVCDRIIEQERAMAERIASSWDVAAEQSMKDEGVPV